MASKYKAKKQVLDGITFDSKKECNRYQALKFLQEQGQIKNLRVHVPYLLIPTQELPEPRITRKNGKTRTLRKEQGVHYEADFVYEKEGKTVVEDCKGMRTDVYIMTGGKHGGFRRGYKRVEKQV